jgi:hypothetical protein
VASIGRFGISAIPFVDVGVDLDRSRIRQANVSAGITRKTVLTKSRLTKTFFPYSRRDLTVAEHSRTLAALGRSGLALFSRRC